MKPAAAARPCELNEIASLRELYRREMDCQIIHDSIHSRPGWTREFLLEIGGEPAGYVSVAIAGPWRRKPTVYEFFVAPTHRQRTFDLFQAALPVCDARVIETQTNDPWLTAMLHTFGTRIRTESILFEDCFTTALQLAGAAFRETTTADVPILRQCKLDESARWVVTLDDVTGALKP